MGVDYNAVSGIGMEVTAEIEEEIRKLGEKSGLDFDECFVEHILQNHQV